MPLAAFGGFGIIQTGRNRRFFEQPAFIPAQSLPPAKAGAGTQTCRLDSRLRGND